MKHKTMGLLSIILTCLLGISAAASDFNFGWKFAKGGQAGSENLAFNDSQWAEVKLPHDMSIAGPFSQDNPSYSRGAWLPAGKCAYRKHFTLPESASDGKVFVYFDGAYRNAEVFINGHRLGMRPLGYIWFEYDLTDHVRFGAAENVLTVKLDNSQQPGSRWYSGTGIYRKVKLITTDKLHIPTIGTYVTTPEVSADAATVNVQVPVSNERAEAADFIIETTLRSPSGRKVETTKQECRLEAGAAKDFPISISVKKPQLWSTESPALYTVCTELVEGKKVLQRKDTTVGIRSAVFDLDKGFLLNGKVVKIKGACLHHAGGPLGAACQPHTYERQLGILKQMGCNAVRTAHNPFAEEFLDECDRQGILVMAEAFDEWQIPKAPSVYDADGGKRRIEITYYAHLFDKWAKRDLQDMLLRDRNHPSIIMWSVGNEIDQMKAHKGIDHAAGAKLAGELVAMVRELDPRPVTCGVNAYYKNKNTANEAAVAQMDIAGYNYIRDPGMYDDQRRDYPQRRMVCTEVASAQPFVPRGTYAFKGVSDLSADTPQMKQVLERRGGFTDGINAWLNIVDRPFISGMFIWTGWDYLGEVVPYTWPARSSSFGPIDLCGFPKDGFYFYQAQWTAEPMLHIFPHWNWEGSEGKTIPVQCFSNCDEVELILNGHPRGRKKVDLKSAEIMTWNVAYEPGALKAIGYRDGKPVSTQVINTAGTPAKLKLESSRKRVWADGQDIVYLEVSVLDADGNLVPRADNAIKFRVEGSGAVVGVGNGNHKSHESLAGTEHKAFNGRCLAIVQAGRSRGAVTVHAEAEGLKAAAVKIKAVK